jgi:hypothetical protein
MIIMGSHSSSHWHRKVDLTTLKTRHVFFFLSFFPAYASCGATWQCTVGTTTGLQDTVLFFYIRYTV